MPEWRDEARHPADIVSVMTCRNAPALGHRSDAARRACRECNPTRPHGSHHGQDRTFADVSLALPRGVSSQRCIDIERDLADEFLSVAEAGDVVEALSGVAGRLIEDPATRVGSGSHWLCELVADVADGVDPGTVADEVGDAIADALVAGGLPWVAAHMVGNGIAEATEQVLTPLLPQEPLVLALRTLGLMICPDPDRCPASERLALPIAESALDTRAAATSVGIQ